MAYQGT